jgi:hypothetical protein
MSLWGVLLNSGEVHAMSLDQMKTLAGSALLDLRLDAVLRRCGLPAAIADTADVSQPRQAIRWQGVQMKLSSMKWEVIYSRPRDVAMHENGWINPGSGSVACLSGLSGLVLHAKGDAGVLTVKKRADNQGYLTAYRVPKYLYAAHQVIGLTGSWKQGMPISRLQERYGKPDEVLDRAGGIKHYRYWVVAKQKQMPVSVHAVDFEVKDTEKVCNKYTVQTSGFEFVQEKLDTLLREWERDYVLD